MSFNIQMAEEKAFKCCSRFRRNTDIWRYFSSKFFIIFLLYTACVINSTCCNKNSIMLSLKISITLS